jgi:tetratricopeptide (TPR) repeat protein
MRLMSTSVTDERKERSAAAAGVSAAQEALSKALHAWRVERKRDDAAALFAEARRLASESNELETGLLAHGHGAMCSVYEFDDFGGANDLLCDAVRLIKLHGSRVSPRSRFIVHWQVAQFAHRFQGNWTTAEQHYTMAQSIDGSNAALLVDHARMYIDRGAGKSDYATATTKLQQILKQWPENVDALTWLAFVYDQAHRDANQAQTYYERALAVDATHLDALRMYADFCLEARNDRHRAAELRARFEAQLARRRPTKIDGLA